MATKRHHPLNSTEVRGITILVCLLSVVYSVYGLFRHWHFFTNYDLGIFDQAVWHLSRFEAPASSISGFSNILGDHFYPIIACFAPLYWVASGPETLIVAQALLFAISTVPVFLILRTRLPTGPVFALCGSYGLFWGLQRAAAFDVHPIAFSPVLIAISLLATDRRQWTLLWVAAAALVLVKEDLTVYLTFLGLYLVLQGEQRRGAILVAASLCAFLVIIGVVIPAFSDSGQYNHVGAFSDSLRRPWRIPVALVTPPLKLNTLLMWLAPFAFLSLRSPFALLLIPFVLTRLLSNNELHWGTSFHYSAPLAPILAVSAGDGLSRIARRVARPDLRRRWLAAAATCCVLLSSILPGGQPFWDLFSADHYQPAAFHHSGYAALALIPHRASVVAQAAVLPHLSQRESIYVLAEEAPDAEFVVSSDRLSPWPNQNYGDIQTLLDDRQRRGYRLVFEENGWTVLRR